MSESMTGRFIRLKYDMHSGTEALVAGTVLEVVAGNEWGVRVADNKGGMHVIATSDFEWIADERPGAGA